MFISLAWKFPRSYFLKAALKIYWFSRFTTVFLYVKKPTFSQLPSAGSLSCLIPWWFGCKNRVKKLEIHRKEQADPKGRMVYFPNFAGPYELIVWFINKNIAKDDLGRKWGWRWGSGFEVFVSLPCPVLKFTFTFSLLSSSCLKYDGTEILCGYS